MENPVKAIYKFQKDAGLLDKGYDDFLESSFQIEEALEGFPRAELANFYYTILNEDKVDKEHDFSAYTKFPKDISREIVKTIQFKEAYPNDISDVDRLDKACDAVVYAIGSMAKLGLNPQQITKALNVVNYHNRQKLNMAKDEHGKLLKPDNFVGPEPELQKILDER